MILSEMTQQCVTSRESAIEPSPMLDAFTTLVTLIPRKGTSIVAALVLCHHFSQAPKFFISEHRFSSGEHLCFHKHAITLVTAVHVEASFSSGQPTRYLWGRHRTVRYQKMALSVGRYFCQRPTNFVFIQKCAVPIQLAHCTFKNR